MKNKVKNKVKVWSMSDDICTIEIKVSDEDVQPLLDLIMKHFSKGKK